MWNFFFLLRWSPPLAQPCPVESILLASLARLESAGRLAISRHRQSTWRLESASRLTAPTD